MSFSYRSSCSCGSGAALSYAMAPCSLLPGPWNTNICPVAPRISLLHRLFRIRMHSVRGMADLSPPRHLGGRRSGKMTWSGGAHGAPLELPLSGHGDEAGVGHHPVVGTDAPLGDVPGPHQDFDRMGLAEPG